MLQFGIDRLENLVFAWGFRDTPFKTVLFILTSFNSFLKFFRLFLFLRKFLMGFLGGPQTMDAVFILGCFRGFR
jgi:hypothetical protein